MHMEGGKLTKQTLMAVKKLPASLVPLRCNMSGTSCASTTCWHHRQERTMTDHYLHLHTHPSGSAQLPWPGGSQGGVGTGPAGDRAPGTEHCLREKPHPNGESRHPAQAPSGQAESRTFERVIKEVYINYRNVLIAWESHQPHHVVQTQHFLSHCPVQHASTQLPQCSPAPGPSSFRCSTLASYLCQISAPSLPPPPVYTPFPRPRPPSPAISYTFSSCPF